MPVSLDENSTRSSSAEKEAPVRLVVPMNCSMVYCFTGWPAAAGAGAVGAAGGTVAVGDAGAAASMTKANAATAGATTKKGDGADLRPGATGNMKASLPVEL